MRDFFRKINFFLGWIVFVLVIFPIVVHGKEEVGFSVDKKLINLEIDPGGERVFSINFKNLINKEQIISVDTKDFEVEENNQIKIMPEGNPIHGMANWIEVFQDKWIAQGSVQFVKNFKVKVPKDAIVGSHWTFLTFRSSPVVDVNNFDKPIVSAEIGVYVLVTVKGEVVAKGELENFFAPIIASDKNNFKLSYRNLGNVHHIPQGRLVVTNLLTGKQLTEKIEEHLVFPGKRYTFIRDWEIPSIFGVYQAKAFFLDGEQNQLTKKRFIFGKYSFFVAGLILILAGWVVHFSFFKVKNIKLK